MKSQEQIYCESHLSEIDVDVFFEIDMTFITSLVTRNYNRVYDTRLNVIDVKQKSRKRELVDIRKMVMYIVSFRPFKFAMGSTLQVISYYFMLDHATTVYCNRTAPNLIYWDDNLKQVFLKTVKDLQEYAELKKEVLYNEADAVNV